MKPIEVQLTAVICVADDVQFRLSQGRDEEFEKLREQLQKQLKANRLEIDSITDPS